VGAEAQGTKAFFHGPPAKLVNGVFAVAEIGMGMKRSVTHGYFPAR
jgi:hypothetical protein